MICSCNFSYSGDVASFRNVAISAWFLSICVRTSLTSCRNDLTNGLYVWREHTSRLQKPRVECVTSSAHKGSAFVNLSGAVLPCRQGRLRLPIRHFPFPNSAVEMPSLVLLRIHCVKSQFLHFGIHQT